MLIRIATYTGAEKSPSANPRDRRQGLRSRVLTLETELFELLAGGGLSFRPTRRGLGRFARRDANGAKGNPGEKIICLLYYPSVTDVPWRKGGWDRPVPNGPPNELDRSRRRRRWASRHRFRPAQGPRAWPSGKRSPAGVDTSRYPFRSCRGRALKDDRPVKIDRGLYTGRGWGREVFQTRHARADLDLKQSS